MQGDSARAGDARNVPMIATAAALNEMLFNTAMFLFVS